MHQQNLKSVLLSAQIWDTCSLKLPINQTIISEQESMPVCWNSDIDVRNTRLLWVGSVSLYKVLDLTQKSKLVQTTAGWEKSP